MTIPGLKLPVSGYYPDGSCTEVEIVVSGDRSITIESGDHWIHFTSPEHALNVSKMLKSAALLVRPTKQMIVEAEE